MPICITCSTPVKHLYTTYSKADDRSLGKGVRLTQCPNCKRFADKYVEHDYVVLFIDLVLIKPQVYRHLLFNRLGTSSNRLDPSILRLGILLILFDVYITWARIERANSNPINTARASYGFWFSPPPEKNFASAPIITQYLFFLTLNVVATLVQHGVIRGLAKVLVKPGGWVVGEVNQGDAGNGNSTGGGVGTPSVRNHVRSSSSPSKALRGSQATNMNLNLGLSQSTSSLGHQGLSQSEVSNTQSIPSIDIGHSSAPHRTRPDAQTSPSAISTALLVSSCTKLFPILLVIWPTTTGSGSSEEVSEPSALAPFAYRATSYIGWVVLLNNIEALLILLDCGYVVATTLAVAGVLCRWIVEGWILSAVGLIRESEGPVGDVVMLWSWIVGRWQ